MVIVGLGAVYAGTQYHLGSLSHMGPGFFPAAIGTLLAFVGLLIALSARPAPTADDVKPASDGHQHAFPDLRGAACIVLGILAFLLLGEWGGLLPATFAIVFISALGDRSNTLKQAFLLSLAMCAVAVAVFWWALQLQLPLFQWS
ncbi:tripartite tricarboxylate transporter TctB [Bordetella trematum]|uniref:tripartite tricarboxylate transporter TctB family protein n=1 Tax=Bordetella trematum TaxID=123899 RepID=UPI000C772328|nr:tripartite tricarboxylate transporter TctB family protein [Bordetella trematum]AUL48380.1 tripartite tricarboxylate transporter TctB [Bordetella trematum]